MNGKGLRKWPEAMTFIIFVLVALPTIGLAAEISLKLGHVAPPGSLYDAAATKFGERMAANTKGKLEVKLFGSSQAISWAEGESRKDW